MPEHDPALSRQPVFMPRPSAFDLVVIVPVYNHPTTVGPLVQALLAQGQRCLLVDDGSEPGCAQVLAKLAQAHPKQVQLLRLAVNQGKGGAMLAGFERAAEMGHTHALQIDADGQHAVGDVPRFVELARAHPQAVICGCPVYDDSVPKGRLYGRYATHIWVWINTLSLDIRDSMCGFRVYPLADTVALTRSAHIGLRMDFDPEIAVRLHWRGLAFINQPTQVTYPADGISHFRMWRDNVLISRMHTRLFFGMLGRLPLLLWRKLRPRAKPAVAR